MFTLPLPCSFYHSLHTVTPSLCGSSTFGSPTHITHHPLILISEKREKPEFERRNLKWLSCFTYTYICIIFFACPTHWERPLILINHSQNRFIFISILLFCWIEWSTFLFSQVHPFKKIFCEQFRWQEDHYNAIAWRKKIVGKT